MMRQPFGKELIFFKGGKFNPTVTRQLPEYTVPIVRKLFAAEDAFKPCFEQAVIEGAEEVRDVQTQEETWSRDAGKCVYFRSEVVVCSAKFSVSDHATTKVSLGVPLLKEVG